MQPEEAIRLATRLLDDPNAPEIDCRAAAHLAYYAVYHLVCDHFRIDPYTSHDDGKHKAVRDRLRAFNPIAASPLLQIVNGGALQFAWAGSQTLISQLAEGEAEYLGRFSFFARIGTTVAPMIAGVAWDLGGAGPLMDLALPGA